MEKPWTTPRLCSKAPSDGIPVTPQIERLGGRPGGPLRKPLEEAEAFFRGGRLIMDIGPGELTQDQLTSVRTLVSARHPALGDSEPERSDHPPCAFQRYPHTACRAIPSPENPRPEVPPEQQALLVQQTLVPGRAFTILVTSRSLGDVNPGAEIIAGGNIVVWGALRGLAHAGAFGDEEFVICAPELQPSQLRIAGTSGALLNSAGVHRFPRSRG